MSSFVGSRPPGRKMVRFNVRLSNIVLMQTIIKVTADIGLLFWAAGDLAIIIISVGSCIKAAFGPLPFIITFLFIESYKILMMALVGVCNVSAFVQFAIITNQRFVKWQTWSLEAWKYQATVTQCVGCWLDAQNINPIQPLLVLELRLWLQFPACIVHFIAMLSASFNPAEAELCSIFIFSSHPPTRPPNRESKIQTKIYLDLKSKVVSLNGLTLELFSTLRPICNGACLLYTSDAADE